MSAKLNLSGHLLDQGRRLAAQGRHADALRLFQRLACAEQHLRSRYYEKVQVDIARLHWAEGKHRTARRRAQIALACNAHNPEYHHLLAQLHDDDENGDPALAAEHFRHAILLNPENALYYRDFGLFLLSAGTVRQGLRYLHRAVRLEPGNLEYLANLVEAMMELGMLSAAERRLRLARFLHPHNQRLADLQDRAAFLRARQKQEKEAMQRSRWSAEPMILKFKRPKKPRPNQATASDGTIVRLDDPQVLPPAHEPPAKKRRRI